MVNRALHRDEGFVGHVAFEDGIGVDGVWCGLGVIAAAGVEQGRRDRKEQEKRTRMMSPQFFELSGDAESARRVTGLGKPAMAHPRAQRILLANRGAHELAVSSTAPRPSRMCPMWLH